MTVDEARREYQAWSRALHSSPLCQWCRGCQWICRQIDAASIALDLAVAEESRERIRQAVAW